MLARVITLQFDPAIGAFDDTVLRDFLKDKAVHSIREHFFIMDDVPYLTVFITYRLKSMVTPTAEKPSRNNDRSWRSLLEESDFPLFNALRDWRLERSHTDGVPPYIIATNKQLALMAKGRPQSLTELGHIERFGKSRVAKYGGEMLAVLSRDRRNGRDQGPSTESQESANDDA